MLEVCLLGIGGTMPLPDRHLTALMVRYNGHSILIDCGEGTQVAIRKQGWSLHPIDVILFTHFHADHIAGLPGLLLSLSKQDRTEPVHIIGPEGLIRCVRALCTIAPGLPYDLKLTELRSEDQIFQIDGLRIEPFRAFHSVPCYGYSLILNRAGKFNPQKAQELGIDKRYWKRLQKGERIQTENRDLTPEMVLGPPRKGLKVTYCTDTRPTENIARHARGADLFICEGTYGDETKYDNAIEYRHMLFREAAELARTAKVKELWLTHYSPSMPDPLKYLDTAKAIFPHTVAPLERRSVDLQFSQ